VIFNFSSWKAPPGAAEKLSRILKEIEGPSNFISDKAKVKSVKSVSQFRREKGG
ncbi:unnamed protein product, partial [marine sediment metagenome]